MGLKKLVHFAGRSLLGANIGYLGLQAALEPGHRPEAAAKTLAQIRKVVPIPLDDEMVVRINGAAQAVGGVALSLGIFPRLAAAGLIASLVPTTLAGHAFWEHEDEGAKKAQFLQFQKNAALVGGLLTVVATGKPKSVKKK